MYRNKSANVHQFAMVPRSDVPRGRFRAEKSLKTTFDASLLVPILCEEVLPGDHWKLDASMFGRLATPIFPVMDNLYLETFFFFCPNRLVWENWTKFMGEQANPGDSINFLVPVLNSGTTVVTGDLRDYFGIPLGTYANTTINALPLRAYNLIYNEWFRDENLQNSLTVPINDGPDALGLYTVRRRGKRKDYFTSCLPWPQKATTPVGIGLTGTVQVQSAAAGSTNFTSSGWNAMRFNLSGGNTVPSNQRLLETSATGVLGGNLLTPGTQSGNYYPSNLFVDLGTASAITINQLRTAFQTQKLLERDARGGTRYTELLQAHFGVRSPDSRLQRPEYLGGGRTLINMAPVPQTGGTGTGADTPQGTLSGYSTVLARGHKFSQAFTEHGYVIGIANVRADLTYQQGLRRHWSRRTRYDYYWPAFAMLGEQAVLNKEIFKTDVAVTDMGVFGYQERWAEYRYLQNEITGLFRSDAAGTIDPWHYAQDFAALPTLNATFIEENVPLLRSLAVGAGANGQQILLDVLYRIDMTRPVPMFSTPGLVDHF